MYGSSTITVVIQYCNCINTTGTTVVHCNCSSTASYGYNEPFIQSSWDESPPPPRRRIQKPPPDYVLPCLPAMRAELTPWKGRDYMLRRKV